jgi:hypothetical protein
MKNGEIPAPTVRSECAGEFTLRDHFAIIALKEIIHLRPRDTAESKALEAYQIADSMMRQRERHSSGLR